MNTNSPSLGVSSPAAQEPRTIANLLTIAGVDPSGGAGVLADIKTFSALAGYGCAVITALTAQNTRQVTGIYEVPSSFIKQQIDTLFSDVRIDYAKIGMLGNAAVARAVADSVRPLLADGRLPGCVLDPVMISKGGDLLLEMEAIHALVDLVLPLATLITPNLPEGAILVGRRAPENVAEMRVMAEALHKLLPDDQPRWVMLKGGRLPGDPLDLLFDGERMIELPGRRVETRNLHGTGCTLAAALTALIPRSADVPVAAEAARSYLVKTLEASSRLTVGHPDGHGHGPVHHFHSLWKS
ncbi:MAG: bifunctional hydroxymethylpyrimidine kinase/phosphomethylpyrimidine kinase [Lautropia sp.]|nr:bifunctional hydroxymethylpyrimidine kinase/phosphomethylpyrimidine kinase [Lautropia sp.]